LSKQKGVAVNEAARRLLGVDETVGSSDALVQASDVAGSLFASSTGEATLVSANNDCLHALMSKQPLWADDANLRIVSLSVSDTRALRDAQRDRRALDVCRVGVYEQDLVSGEFSCSPLLRQIYGLNSEQSLTLQTFAEAFHPADSARVMDEIIRSQDP